MQNMTPKREKKIKTRSKKKKILLIAIVALLLAVVALVGAYCWIFIWNRPADTIGYTDMPYEDENIVVKDEEIIITRDELFTVQPDDLNVNASLSQGVKNILLLGTDSRLASGNGLTDTIIILSIDQSNNAVKLTSIMRDTWVTIPGRSSQGKINAANVYGGPYLAMKTVNSAFGMNIDDYVLVNMQGMSTILKMIGGIRMDVTKDERTHVNRNLDGYRGDLIVAKAKFDEDDFKHLEEYGEDIMLTPQQALAYARIRMLDSDYARSDRQRKVLIAIVNEITKQNMIQIANIAGAMMPHVSTSLTLNELISLGKAAWNIDLETVDQLRIPADNTFQSGNYNGTWCIRPNFEKNIALLHEFVYGEGGDS